MLNSYHIHNLFKQSIDEFIRLDPHLNALNQLKYQHHPKWWDELDCTIPGIYILTGGRQVGKSTSCKLLIQHCLENRMFSPETIFYLPCDEIFDAKALSRTIRYFLEPVSLESFLLIIDEVTFVEQWDRVIKGLADEGWFRQGVCILTGSDALILKEAAMRFPGRRGASAKLDFHLYPLTFREYVDLVVKNETIDAQHLALYFENYLKCGGYLRAINDLAQHGEITQASFFTYEQWIRGDFLKHDKKEAYLLAILRAFIKFGVSQISFSALAQKVGLMSKETCIDYCHLLERMDVLIQLQAYDFNKKTGSPKKARKFHFFDPFIQHTMVQWLQREGYIDQFQNQSQLVESCVASHLFRFGKTFYFKGQGEVDVVWLRDNTLQAFEVKWGEQIRPVDLKMLKQFRQPFILTKIPYKGQVDHIKSIPVYEFLYQLPEDPVR